jgi:hypothetical protein
MLGVINSEEASKGLHGLSRAGLCCSYSLCPIKGVNNSRQPLMHCTACRIVSYCSSDCQKQHWITHKKDCSFLSTMEITIPSQGEEDMPSSTTGPIGRTPVPYTSLTKDITTDLSLEESDPLIGI